jgi:hypothetical protein
MHGIRSETGGLVRAERDDFMAAAHLAEFVDRETLAAILSNNRRKIVSAGEFGACRSRRAINSSTSSRKRWLGEKFLNSRLRLTSPHTLLHD